MVMDWLLKSLPDEIGADIDGVKVGAIAFADNFVLTASTAAGLQQLLNSAGGFLALCGISGEIFFCVNWNGASAEEDHCRSRHVSLRWPKICRQEKN